jgi:hypothetical protein
LEAEERRNGTKVTEDVFLDRSKGETLILRERAPERRGRPKTQRPGDPKIAGP